VTLLDFAAVDRLRDEPIDWRHKGMPPDVSTVDGLLGRRVPVDGFTSPVAVLCAEAVTANLDTYTRFCAGRGLDLAPHLKTTMAPQLAAEQARRGAWGFTVANVAQARVLRAFGARRILIAHEVVDPAAVAWLAAEQEHAEVACWVDSLSTVDTLAAAGREIPVYVELGAVGGRTGARGVASAMEVVRAVRAAPGLRLAGVCGYEGSYGSHRSSADTEKVRGFLADLVALGRAVDAEIVTAGGSAYPDLVADELAGLGPGVRKVLRSGAYVAHDHGHYTELSPFPLQPALRVWAVVVSVPEPGLALLNLGKRDAAFDLALPIPLNMLRDNTSEPLTEVTVTALNDQHAYLSDPAGVLRVGDWVECGISHPCTMFDRWTALPLVDAEGRVTDLIRTFF
jgi:D-serine deaminase-like pyridoxal phosphate-dependent protein